MPRIITFSCFISLLLQFRIIENKLGLKRKSRLKFNKDSYDSSLNKKDQIEVNDFNVSPHTTAPDLNKRELNV